MCPLREMATLSLTSLCLKSIPEKNMTFEHYDHIPIEHVLGLIIITINQY